jgi:hypothetical protein
MKEQELLLWWKLHWRLCYQWLSHTGIRKLSRQIIAIITTSRFRRNTRVIIKDKPCDELDPEASSSGIGLFDR